MIYTSGFCIPYIWEYGTKAVAHPPSHSVFFFFDHNNDQDKNNNYELKKEVEIIEQQC